MYFCRESELISGQVSEKKPVKSYVAGALQLIFLGLRSSYLDLMLFFSLGRRDPLLLLLLILLIVAPRYQLTWVTVQERQGDQNV